jgi:hypothetical protein
LREEKALSAFARDVTSPSPEIETSNEVLRPELARVVGKQKICYYKIVFTHLTANTLKICIF